MTTESIFPKPHKTASIMGITYVKEIVCKEVKQVLFLMHENKGSFIRRNNILNFACLIIPGMPPFKIEQGYIITILGYCITMDNYVDDFTNDFELHSDAINHIKHYL